METVLAWFLIVGMVIMGGYCVWAVVDSIRDPRLRRNFQMLRLAWKHAGHRGFGTVKDARDPRHVIIHCDEHDMLFRSNPDWQPYAAQD